MGWQRKGKESQGDTRREIRGEENAGGNKGEREWRKRRRERDREEETRAPGSQSQSKYTSKRRCEKRQDRLANAAERRGSRRWLGKLSLHLKNTCRCSRAPEQGKRRRRRRRSEGEWVQACPSHVCAWWSCEGSSEAIESDAWIKDDIVITRRTFDKHCLIASL